MNSDEEEPSLSDSFSILVATDNHLGYLEKDTVRGEDSFVAFEEVLQHAVRHDVDLILLGGDLFHDNKPSRQTIHRAISLLRKYCFGDKPIQVEFLSDQKENFHTSTFQKVNYEDPNLNVGIPVFSIHGNHDDPSGQGGLCALDLLSASGVLNYFGKTPSIDEITISPLLLKKGKSKLAVYGLGSVRDERLHRIFLAKKVKVLRPDQDQDDWFNIFVIHQNHVKRGSTNTSYIPEEFLPDFIDMVIWGHEHDCIPELHHNETINAYVLQPGSSVATSLSQGETLPKHCFKLVVYKKKFSINKIPLTTVRPFIYKEVSLIDQDITNEKDIYTFLQYNVDMMIEEAQELKENNPNCPDLPLIRLRYDYTGDTIPINSAKFGGDYTKRVANPRDMLLCNKKKEARSYSYNDAASSGRSQDEGRRSRLRSPAEETLRILEEKGQSLGILLEDSLRIASEDFVHKLENDSVSEYISFAMEQCEKYLRLKSKTDDDIEEKIRVRKTIMSKEGDVEEARKRWEQRRKDKEAGGLADAPDSDSDLETLSETKPAKRGRGRGRATRARGTTSTRGTRGKRGAKVPAKGNLDSFLSNCSMPTSTPSGRVASGRSAAQKAKSAILEFSDSDE